MEITPLQGKITEFSPNCALKMNESLGKHTSFRIGGNAEVMAFPKSPGELSEILKISSLLDCKCRILGAGTNVLAPDEGVEGIVICLKDGLNDIKLLENNRLQVSSGVTMTRAAVFAANAGLSGMEFAHGIPGTVGGGIYMNAGAYGGEISQICESVTLMSRTGQISTLTAEEMKFSYRHSILEDSDDIVICAVFRLTPMPTEQIKDKMKDLMVRRSGSQPLDFPSAGSAFKRPAGHYAAALIEQAGLKGYRVGNAAISEKHAGFAVNLGDATAADVRNLLVQVSDIVFDKFNVRLEPEVRIW